MTNWGNRHGFSLIEYMHLLDGRITKSFYAVTNFEDGHAYLTKSLHLERQDFGSIDFSKISCNSLRELRVLVDEYHLLNDYVV